MGLEIARNGSGNRVEPGVIVGGEAPVEGAEIFVYLVWIACADDDRRNPGNIEEPAECCLRRSFVVHTSDCGEFCQYRLDTGEELGAEKAIFRPEIRRHMRGRHSSGEDSLSEGRVRDHGD
jgi:hypothetical protein